MDRSPTFKAFLPTIVVLMVIGWGGIVILFNSTEPTLWPRWLFFVFVVVAFTGTMLPASVYLNHRFPSKPPASARVMVRQALWVGIFAATLLWLNYGQVLSFSLAMIFFVGFMAIEVFLRLWERSQWRRP
jgi:hypothetical protein